MDEWKKGLKGSPSRDIFKAEHKKRAPKSFYACDLDFVLVAKFPSAHIVAILDYKKPRDNVSFSEVIAYNELSKHIPLYIIRGNDPKRGPFIIERYDSGDHRPEPPIVNTTPIRQCESWQDLAEWEKTLRECHPNPNPVSKGDKDHA
jgi:hypothetical protein